MTMQDMAGLDTLILSAHAADDRAALATLYGAAAQAFNAGGDLQSACFFYTQAYVFALESGLPAAEGYAAFLRVNRRL